MLDSKDGWALRRQLQMVGKLVTACGRKVLLVCAIPTWTRLRDLGRRRLVSMGVVPLVAVPLACRISAALTSGEHVAGSVLLFLDAQVAQMPPNLLRLFWAAALSSLSATLFRFCCPGIVRRAYTESEWVDRTDAGMNVKKRLTTKHGITNSDEITSGIAEAFRDARESADSAYVGIRATVALLYVASVLLLIRIALSQLALVAKSTRVRELFL